MSTLRFLPMPVEVREEAGEFLVNRNVTVVLPAAADEQDMAAVGRLLDDLSQAGADVPLAKRFANNHPGPVIALARADRDLDWLRSNPALFNDAELPELPPDGYYLRIHPEGMLLVGADAAGLFYAVETLAQALQQAGARLPALTITDYPTFPVRGVMLDVSRGKVPKLDDLLELVDHLAAWKINHFQLYLEHTFAWPSHPKIGEGYDPLTAEEIITLDRACAKRHIDFVPNLQSFGHQGHMLRLRKYGKLAESERKWTLTPADSGTYELLDELYAEFLPNFRSPLFNVDCDETWDLGTGRSAGLVAEKGEGRVYLDHLLKLRKLAARYGRRIMFWGDIILHHPELIPEVPDDVIVLQWEYGPEPREESVRKFADAGKRFYVCPGTNAWTSLFPRQAEMRANVSTMAAYGAKYGAAGVLNTDWGDGGHYNLQGLSFYAYAFGAAESWRSGSAGQDFDDTFAQLFYGVGWEAVRGAMHHLERAAEPAPGLRITDAVAFHTSFLRGTIYRETLTSEAAAVIRESGEAARELLRHVRDRTNHPLVVEELRLAALQVILLGMKAELAVQFHRRYAALKAANDVPGLLALEREMRPQIIRLAESITGLPEAFAPLWLARARKAGLREVQEYQLEIAADLEAAAAWLTKAARTAKSTGQLPDLPDASDHWTPKYWTVQMGG